MSQWVHSTVSFPAFILFIKINLSSNLMLSISICHGIFSISKNFSIHNIFPPNSKSSTNSKSPAFILFITANCKSIHVFFKFIFILILFRFHIFLHPIGAIKYHSILSIFPRDSISTSPKFKFPGIIFISVIFFIHSTCHPKFPYLKPNSQLFFLVIMSICKFIFAHSHQNIPIPFTFHKLFKSLPSA